MAIIKLINGLPVSVAPYEESIYYPTGLTASTPVTLPNSGEFNDGDAKDLQVVVNKTVQEVLRDFTVIGTAPHTQIQFVRDLPDDAVLKFKMNF